VAPPATAVARPTPVARSGATVTAGATARPAVTSTTPLGAAEAGTPPRELTRPEVTGPPGSRGPSTPQATARAEVIGYTIYREPHGDTSRIINFVHNTN